MAHIFVFDTKNGFLLNNVRKICIFLIRVMAKILTSKILRQNFQKVLLKDLGNFLVDLSLPVYFKFHNFLDFLILKMAKNIIFLHPNSFQYPVPIGHCNLLFPIFYAVLSFSKKKKWKNIFQPEFRNGFLFLKFNFGPKFRFLAKISIFDEKFDFCPKF